MQPHHSESYSTSKELFFKLVDAHIELKYIFQLDRFDRNNKFLNTAQDYVGVLIEL